MAPSIISLRIQKDNRFKLKLWLPVFILWPPAIILFLMVAPFLLIAEAVLALRGTPMHLFRMLGGIVSVLSSLRGTLVNVKSPRKDALVMVKIY